MSLREIFGTSDYTDYLKYKGKSGPLNKAEAGKRLLWKNNPLAADKLFGEALAEDEQLAAAGKPSAAFTNIQAEIFNLKRLTRELTTPTLYFMKTTSNIGMKQEYYDFTDDNNDGNKQSWEKYKYDINNKPVTGLRDAAQSKEEIAAGYKKPYFDMFKGLQGGYEFNVRHDDYKGSLDTRFKLYPYIDPDHPEYTPDYLKDLYGREYTACSFGPLESQDATFNVYAPTFKVLKSTPVISQIFSRLYISYKNTLTEMGMTANYGFKYNEITEDMEPSNTQGLFVSDRQDTTVGIESRTFPIFEWPSSIYPAFTLECKNSTLSKNMSSIYELSARNYEAPEYDKDVKLTDAQRKTITDDYYNNYLPKVLDEKEVLASNEVSLGARMNIPGFIQLIRGTKIVDESKFSKGSDYPIKLSYRVTWTNNDYLRNSDNGLYPVYRDHFAEWHLDGSGNLVKEGRDLHEKMEAFNGSSWNLSVDHKLRLGDLCSIKHIYDRTYYSDFNFTSLRGWGTSICRILWFVPGAVWPLAKYPISLIDNGSQKSTPVYMPLKWSWSGGSYMKDGISMVSNSSSLSIGIGISDNLELEYRTYTNEDKYKDNGASYYKDAGQNLTLRWFFH